jgi:hypothetical protein
MPREGSDVTSRSLDNAMSQGLFRAEPRKDAGKTAEQLAGPRNRTMVWAHSPQLSSSVLLMRTAPPVAVTTSGSQAALAMKNGR